jgi:hypothetical protein
MSFKRFTPSDFLVSADSITSPCWSNEINTLTAFFTSSTQEASLQGDYVLAVYNTVATYDSASIQFYIGYCDANGSGSTAYNTAIPSLSPSRTLYGQYRNLILEDENAGFIFGEITSSQFFAISVERANYKQSLLPGSLNLVLSGSSANTRIQLTDNSNDISVVPYINGTRVYQLVTGSNGSATATPTGATTAGYTASGSYGWFVPDMGTILLNAKALQLPVAAGGIALAPSTGSSNVANGLNNTILYRTINAGSSFQLNSQENVTSDYVFVRPQNAEFNYTTNPSFISGSTGEVIYSQFINNPQTYITTVGLYNDANELLAVAKLSKPLVKDFTKEALIRVKLDF